MARLPLVDVVEASGRSPRRIAGAGIIISGRLADSKKMLKLSWGAVFLMACSAPFCEGAGKAVFSGTVIDAKTKQPIPGVSIHFSPEQKAGPIFQRFLLGPDKAEKALAVTDAQGRFRVEVDAGTYSYSATKYGFYGYEVDRSEKYALGSAFILAPGEVVNGVVIRLLPSSRISGSVLDAAGTAVEGALVYVLSAPDPRHPSGNRGQTKTKKGGKFEFPDFYPDKFVLAVQAPACRLPPPNPADPGSQRVYAITYWPASVELERAPIIDPQGGDEVFGLEVRLVPVKGLQISGNLEGEPSIYLH